MKNGTLSVNLFPNSGHHFYFIPLAIGQGQGTSGAQRYSRDHDLPNLPPQSVNILSTLCTSGPDWMPAKDNEGNEIVWLRGQFGTRRETAASNQELTVFGLWCAIESSTGTRHDGYTFDVNSRPAHDDPDWVDSKQHADTSPYFCASPSEVTFGAPQLLNLDDAFDLSGKVGSPIGLCKLEINWLVEGGQPVPVSLIVDFGNTRTIAVGLERADRIANSSLREIIRPILFKRGHDEAAPVTHRPKTGDLIPNSWIILREATFAADRFTPGRFVWADYETEQIETGFLARLKRQRPQERLTKIIYRVPYMFVELSPVVFGPEATDLLADSDVSGGHLSFLSSPKRYSWDDDPVGQGGMSVWYMHPRTGLGKTRQLSGEMFRFLPRNPQLRRALVDSYSGSPTEWSDQSQRPTPRPSPPNFGRGDALIWTALAIIERAGKQIQSEAWRSNSPVRRFLDNVVVTFPPGWTNEELLAYWRAWFLAKEIYNWSRGSRPVRITLDMRLDEAVASQLAIVFSEVRKLGDRAADWVHRVGRMRGSSRSVRVLTIDIGGGTTDTAVVEYVSGSASQPHVNLSTEVIFSDSTSNAGDKLVKELIEAVLLPTLGERFRSDTERKQSFERIFSASVGMREAEDRLRRMVITRSVFIPIVYKWLEDISNNRAGNPNTDAKWDPIECGANLAQIEKLNAMFQDAELAEDALLQVGQPFDVDYNKIEEVIQNWCAPLAGLHARYVREFECDLVIVTGKPSELPMVHAALLRILPVDAGRVLFAKDYDAGEWFPAAAAGRIPDAKMVTVVGAALYTAIKSNLIPNWTIDHKIGPQVRNCWGLLSKASKPFHATDIILTPDQDEVEIPLYTNCCIARSRFPENEPEPVYSLRWRNRDKAPAGPSIEVLARIRRVSTDRDGRDLRNEQLELIEISGATLHNEPIELDDLELHLCTLAFDEVHWLDQGRFMVRWT